MNRIRLKKDSVDSFVDAFYPVGSIYMSVNAIDPSTFFGGTWERIAQGRTLVGEGSPQQNSNILTGTITSSQMNWKFNINDTGGEYEHQLTITEMPSHAHQGVIDVTDVGINNGGNLPGVACTYQWNTIGSYIRTKGTGGNGNHNNIQPYLVVYIWKRTK